jgi:hypothetical protein
VGAPGCASPVWLHTDRVHASSHARCRALHHRPLPPPKPSVAAVQQLSGNIGGWRTPACCSHTASHGGRQASPGRRCAHTWAHTRSAACLVGPQYAVQTLVSLRVRHPSPHSRAACGALYSIYTPWRRPDQNSRAFAAVRLPFFCR